MLGAVFLTLIGLRAFRVAEGRAKMVVPLVCTGAAWGAHLALQFIGREVYGVEIVSAVVAVVLTLLVQAGAHMLDGVGVLRGRPGQDSGEVAQTA